MSSPLSSSSSSSCGLLGPSRKPLISELSIVQREAVLFIGLYFAFYIYILTENRRAEFLPFNVLPFFLAAGLAWFLSHSMASPTIQSSLRDYTYSDSEQACESSSLVGLISCIFHVDPATVIEATVNAQSALMVLSKFFMSYIPPFLFALTWLERNTLSAIHGLFFFLLSLSIFLLSSVLAVRAHASE